jgi:hypothetical protein
MVAACRIIHRHPAMRYCATLEIKKLFMHMVLRYNMLKKKLHSLTFAGLSGKLLIPAKELLIPVGKEAYILVGSQKQLAVSMLRTTRYVCLGDIWNESIL